MQPEEMPARDIASHLGTTRRRPTSPSLPSNQNDLLRQMTRACLLHALHPDEEETVILRVSYARPGWMRVGIEALWRVAGPAGGGGGVDGAAAPHQEGAKTLSGWDRDMPAVGEGPNGTDGREGQTRPSFGGPLFVNRFEKSPKSFVVSDP